MKIKPSNSSSQTISCQKPDLSGETSQVGSCGSAFDKFMPSFCCKVVSRVEWSGKKCEYHRDRGIKRKVFLVKKRCLFATPIYDASNNRCIGAAAINNLCQ
jgi:hypothetical protein